VEEDIERHVVEEIEMIWNIKTTKKGNPMDVEDLEKHYDEIIYLEEINELDLEEVDEQLDESEFYTSSEEIEKDQINEVEEKDEDFSLVKMLLIEVKDVDQCIEEQVVEEIRIIWNEKSNKNDDMEEIKYLEKFNDEIVYFEENNEWNYLEEVNDSFSKRKFEPSSMKIDGKQVKKIELNEPDEDTFLPEVVQQDIWEDEVVELRITWEGKQIKDNNIENVEEITELS